MDTIQKEREELIEMFGVYFESLFHVPPLASRILGMLIVDGCKSGLTFETLVERLAASKSSISTNLNLLLKMEKITYYTVVGDRKKYFKAAPISDRMSNYLKMIRSEEFIVDKMVLYREKTASCTEEKCNLENIKSYKKHLQEVENSLIKTIAEFKKIEIANKIIVNNH
jgi:DNA-binding transcriptional regulator GbsR (MarR family)